MAQESSVSDKENEMVHSCPQVLVYIPYSAVMAVAVCVPFFSIIIVATIALVFHLDKTTGTKCQVNSPFKPIWLWSELCVTNSGKEN